MTIAVDWDIKYQVKQTNQKYQQVFSHSLTAVTNVLDCISLIEEVWLKCMLQVFAFPPYIGD